MKVGQDFFPKSSFLSINKDLSRIVNKVLNNQTLLKLLAYTNQDCLKAPDLTMEEALKLLGKQIKIVPKIDIDNPCPTYLIIGFDNFVPNDYNPEYRDCVINIDILCHPDHWDLGDFSLRPYRIAGELDAMLDKQILTGIGKLNLMGAQQLVLNDQLMGLTLVYKAIHGVDDKINPLGD